jgi:phosphate-selective porin
MVRLVLVGACAASVSSAWAGAAPESAGGPQGQAKPTSKGFAVATGDGTKISFGGNAQFRYTANVRDTDDVGDNNDFTHGFKNRRVRLSTQGSVIDPKLTFRVDGDFLNGEDLTLYEMTGAYTFDSGVQVKWGQFKLPLVQEELNSFLKLQAVERSTVNSVFTQNYSQGVEVSRVWESFRLAGAFSDGLNTINTDITAAPEADWAVTGRAEWKWAGEWSQYEQFSSWRGSGYAGFLGVAGHWQSGGSTNGTNDVDVGQYTVDLSLKGDGWNVYTQFVGRRTDAAAAREEFDDFGLIVQGGVFVTEQTEAFLRYDHVFVDDDRETSPGVGGEDFPTITAGVVHYVSPRSHVFKITADVVWHLESQADAGTVVKPSTSTGLLASDKSQVLFRVQTQIVW